MLPISPNIQRCANAATMEAGCDATAKNRSIMAMLSRSDSGIVISRPLRRKTWIARLFPMIEAAPFELAHNSKLIEVSQFTNIAGTNK